MSPCDTRHLQDLKHQSVSPGCIKVGKLSHDDLSRPGAGQGGSGPGADNAKGAEGNGFV